MEQCPDCGFVWAAVPDEEMAPRILDGARSIAAIVQTSPDAATRPAAARWSALEYGAHVRDVLLHVRDRVVIALVEDDPEFKPLYREERVELGLYADDDPETVATELTAAARLFTRTLGRVDDDQLDRPCRYSYPAPATRSVRWMAQQVVHEVEHHLGDVRDDAAGAAAG
ncbi:MAG: DinB family protein [Acidimicrobiia bacterium]